MKIQIEREKLTQGTEMPAVLPVKSKVSVTIATMAEGRLKDHSGIDGWSAKSFHKEGKNIN